MHFLCSLNFPFHYHLSNHLSSGGHLLYICLLNHFFPSVSPSLKAGFLSLSTTDTLDRILLCRGGRCLHCRMHGSPCFSLFLPTFLLSVNQEARGKSEGVAERRIIAFSSSKGPQIRSSATSTFTDEETDSRGGGRGCIRDEYVVGWGRGGQVPGQTGK